MFDGQKVEKSSYKAQQIGEYWNQITDNRGSYHNCHRNQYKNDGIGMLNHDDDQKRENLDTVIEYLCKEEQSVDGLKSSKKDRAFTRGTMPKGKAKMGRPRKEVEKE